MVGAVLLCGALVAGCAQQPSSLDLLRKDTAVVVEALNAKDVPAARRALDVLQADVAAAARLGTLTSGEAAELRATIDRLRADLVLLAPPVVAPSPTQTVPRPDPDRDDDDKEPEKGKGKGGKDD